MEMTYDKINNEVAFRESDHKYFNVKYPDRKYTSVTTLIGGFYEHFDSEFWSSYKALEALMGENFVELGVKKQLLDRKKFRIELLDEIGIEHEVFYTQKQEILDGYEKNKNEACDRGTAYHLEKELRFYKSGKHNLQEYEFNLPCQGEFECEKYNFDMNRERAILPEYLVYWSTKDEILNLAGQIDLLIKDGNDIYILDYKTNAKGIESKAFFDRKKKSTKRMFYPINNLDDTTLNHYTLQLSTYAWMLQRINPELNIKLLRLLHIGGDGTETQYDVPYLKEDVERMLKAKKKQLKVDHFRLTGKML